MLNFTIPVKGLTVVRSYKQVDFELFLRLTDVKKPKVKQVREIIFDYFNMLVAYAWDFRHKISFERTANKEALCQNVRLLATMILCLSGQKYWSCSIPFFLRVTRILEPL